MDNFCNKSEMCVQNGYFSQKSKLLSNIQIDSPKIENMLDFPTINFEFWEKITVFDKKYRFDHKFGFTWDNRFR